MYFNKRGTCITLSDEGDVEVSTRLHYGAYSLEYNQVLGYHLIQLEPFKLPSKTYGRTMAQCNHILTAFKKDGTLGVLLEGVKGSGKTLLAKALAVVGELPVIVITQPFRDSNFFNVLQGIDQPCVVLFDEFEKVYKKPQQEDVLTLFDGAFPLKNKLLVLTCNDKYAVGDYFHNRPGRIRYALKFTGVPYAFIEEYCKDHLRDLSKLQDIKDLQRECRDFNFDMLQAVVKELNDFGLSVEDTIDILNIKKDPFKRAPVWLSTVISDYPEHQGIVWDVKVDHLDEEDPSNSKKDGYFTTFHLKGSSKLPIELYKKVLEDRYNDELMEDLEDDEEAGSNSGHMKTAVFSYTLYGTNVRSVVVDPISGNVTWTFHNPSIQIVLSRSKPQINYWNAF